VSRCADFRDLTFCRSALNETKTAGPSGGSGRSGTRSAMRAGMETGTNERRAGRPDPPSGPINARRYRETGRRTRFRSSIRAGSPSRRVGLFPSGSSTHRPTPTRGLPRWRRKFRSQLHTSRKSAWRSCCSSSCLYVVKGWPSGRCDRRDHPVIISVPLAARA
jgi:hypothetical protein